MATIAVAAPSSREAVMEHLWEKIFDYFEAEQHEKAETTLSYYSRLEEMSDGEYEDACHCDDAECYCNR